MKKLIFELIAVIGGILTIGYLLTEFAPICEKTNCFQWALILAILVAAVVMMYRIKYKTYCKPEGTSELKGPLPLNSRYYMERPPVETECCKTIEQPNALLCIKSPRQMGKSSLLIRILNKAKKHKNQTVLLSLREANKTMTVNLDKFLLWFCTIVTQKSGLPTNQITEHWDDTIDGKTNCSKYFQDFLLRENQSLVLGLDDVEQIFQSNPSLAQDFFALLQTWHELGVNHTTWRKFKLILSYSTEVNLFFNIEQIALFKMGKLIDLTDFSSKQVQQMVRRYRFDWTEPEIQKLTEVLGGHPYLIRFAFYKIIIKQITLDELLQNIPIGKGLFYEHLHHYLAVLQDANLLLIMKQVATASTPIEIDDVAAFKLLNMGLIKFQGNFVIPRCELYRTYFASQTLLAKTY